MKKYFKNFNLIDGTGKGVLIDACLMVENGIIQYIGQDEKASGEVIDLGGKYVMPGMIDCHTHVLMNSQLTMFENLDKWTEMDFLVSAIDNLKKHLESGVVFIRDVGGVDFYDIQLRDHLIKGSIAGPDMYCAGKVITMTGGHGHPIGREADGPVEIRKAVREQLKIGADVVKVIASGGIMTKGVTLNAYQLDVEELKAAVEEAHKAGRKVCTHCHSTQGIKNSIIAGVDSIEHCTIMDEEGADMMAASGTYMVTTLVAINNIAVNGSKEGMPEYAVNKAESIKDRHKQSFKMAMDKGIRLAMGTDAGTPFNHHGQSAMELQLMVEAGMSPMETIITSTKNSSELIGISDLYGTLEVGKYANLIVLEDNPLDDIRIIQKPVAVYKKGDLVV